MIKPGKIIFLFLVFITFSTYLPNFKNESKSLIFPIKKIEIQNQQVIDFNKLSYELDYLLGKSLLFLNQKPIGFSLKKFDLIESFSIKKIYPKTIRIIVTEKKPIAILINSKKKILYI